MYSKGGNMLHTIRQLINKDEKWRQVLRGLNSKFYHKTVTTKEIEEYISKKSGINLSTFFDQYLRDYRIPEFTYIIKGTELKYKWTQVVDGFNMPIKVEINGETKTLEPTSFWKTEKLNATSASLKIDINYYVNSKKLE